MSTVKQIYIVDDNPLVRQGYADLIGTQSDLAVCGEAASATDALREMDRRPCDLMIVDLRLKDQVDGLELIRSLRERRPDLPTIAVTAHDVATYRTRALEAGASYFLNKRDAARQLLGTIREALGG